MPLTDNKARPLRAVLNRILSVPIPVKILGVGFVVALAFGGTTFLVIEKVATGIHLQMIERRAHITAFRLAESLEHYVATGDVLTINRKLMTARGMEQNIRYIIVRDALGGVVAHTFDNGVPRDLLDLPTTFADSDYQIHVLGTENGRIFDAQVPILGGHAGTLQLGISDNLLLYQSRTLTRLLAGVLALSVAMGASFAAVLAYLITHPLRELERVATSIRQGDYSVRVEGLPGDEIGDLGVTFNHMAQSLEEHGRQIQNKENARISLLRQLVDAQEEERKSIARELHDQMGQSLSRVLLTFQCAHQTCGCSQAQCAELEQILGDLIDKVRQMAWHVRPAILDDYGLKYALARYLNEISTHIGYPVRLECNINDESQRLPREVEIGLYRISQEAITNVIRHARASSASVVVLQNQEAVTLVVGDNGCGFDLQNALGTDATSLGLLGMRERTSLLGGDFEVESEPGKGTEVLVSIPLGKVNDDA